MTQHDQNDHHRGHSHEHGHGHGHAHGHGQRNDADLADLLDLDAEVHGSYLGDLAEWLGSHTPDAPSTVVDVGAGTGTGSLALAAQFPTSEVIAIDRSPVMLDRVLAAAGGQGVAERLRVVQADLDLGWPADVGGVDLVWAASSLHEVADPDRVLSEVHDALRPGGLLVVVEMDSLPRFLPDELGMGRPGLESRCHELLDKADWNAHPDWRPHLGRAGFEVVEQRGFAVDADPAPPRTGLYARAYFTRIRAFLDGQLDADDLAALDRLLDDEDPASLLRRGDLTVRGSRTAWAARRP